MSDEDDVKIKATRFQKILDELKEVNRKIDNLMIVNKPKPVNTPVIKDEVYNNKRNVYVNKLNEGHIKYPKTETLAYYEIKYDAEKKVYS